MPITTFASWLGTAAAFLFVLGVTAGWIENSQLQPAPHAVDRQP